MLTRLWQHRYYGLLAMVLLGLSAAVIVMLLPDRQQAFARFSLTPAAVAALTAADAAQQPVPALLDNELVVAKVLQRIEIEAPNPVDPRPVDPIEAYKRNFALRRTAAGGEFEISYVGRSPEKAALGVETWLQATREALSITEPVAAIVDDPTESANASAEVTAAQAAVQRAESELAASRELAAQRTAQRDKLQSELAALRTQLEQFDARHNEADAERAASQARQRETRASALAAAQSQLDQATAAEQQTRAAQRTAAEQLAQAQQALDQARSASNADAVSNRAVLQGRLRQLERQLSAVQREHDQAAERTTALTAQLADTPDTITEIVAAPVAPRDRAFEQRMAAAEAELATLRVRFTDNHPDVRRQLALIEELKAASGNDQGAVANAGTSTRTTANPEYRQLQTALTDNQNRQADLRSRLDDLRRSQAQLEARIAAAASASAGPDAQELSRLNRELTESQARIARTNTEQQVAAQALAAAQAALRTAQQDSGDNAQAGAEPAPQAAAMRRERAAISGQIANVQAALAKARSTAQTAQQDQAAAQSALTQARAALAEAQQASVARTDAKPAPKTAQAGFQILSPLQVVPASSNPNRPHWLWISLLGSLVLGGLFAVLASLRPRGIHSVRELEKVTGLRALGGVPRFATPGRLAGLLLSLFFFVALILIYGLVYIAFIGLVDSGSDLLKPDWTGLLDWARNGASGLATRLGLDPAHPVWQWFWPEGTTGSR